MDISFLTALNQEKADENDLHNIVKISDRQTRAFALIAYGNDAMNRGDAVHYAGGGLVSVNNGGGSGPAAVSSAGPSVSLQISALDAASFGDFLSRGGLDTVKQALFEDNRQFASSVGVW